jgi:hypothetical protein
LLQNRTCGPVGFAAQRLDGELGSERGAADAQCQHVRECVAVGAFPLAVAHRLGEDTHALAVAADIGVDVVAVHRHVLVAAQRHVQGGAAFRDVHFLSGEERGDARGHVALPRERREELQRLAVGALLGKIDRDARALEGERAAACRVALPERFQRGSRHRFAVGEERMPGRRVGEGRHISSCASRGANSNPAPARRPPAPCPPPRSRGA